MSKRLADVFNMNRYCKAEQTLATGTHQGKRKDTKYLKRMILRRRSRLPKAEVQGGICKAEENNAAEARNAAGESSATEESSAAEETSVAEERNAEEETSAVEVGDAAESNAVDVTQKQAAKKEA